ncbi:MAG: hypothetical protein KAS32_09750 [Candidatus Peribacteraceae bacterium]|nr:hypothetical protein [Candidatus Peribacteraceae bacterium]
MGYDIASPRGLITFRDMLATKLLIMRTIMIPNKDEIFEKGIRIVESCNTMASKTATERLEILEQHDVVAKWLGLAGKHISSEKYKLLCGILQKDYL